MPKVVKLITDKQLELKKDLRELRRIIEDKTLELNALRSAYSEMKKDYEREDLRRAKIDGRFRVVEPKTDRVYKRKEGELSKLTKSQISHMIRELEKLQKT